MSTSPDDRTVAPDFALDPALLATLIHDATVGIALLDTDYRYLVINEQLARINGAPREAHLGRSVAEILPDLWPMLKPIYDEVLGGRTVTDVAILGHGEMEGRHWRAGYYPVRGAEGTIVGIGVVIDETTQRAAAEAEVRRLATSERAALESSRAREQDLRAVLAALPDFIFNLTRDGTHVGYHAPREEALFSEPSAFIGRRVHDVLPAPVAAQYERAIARALDEGGTQVFEYALDFAGSGQRLYDARMVAKSAEEVVVIVRDVTELKALEQQLRHSLKMEAIGRLAGGIAHDFNNLLTVINGYAEMLEAEVADGAGAELASEIRQAGERAASLTRQLLLFSRRQRVEPRLVSIDAVVTRAERMLSRVVGEKVQLSSELAGGLPAVLADAGQLEQVLVNLAVNARDAMPDGGCLRLRTRFEPADDVALRRGATGWVILEVSDDGVGMDATVRDRVFEPFFTTKAPGKGTGLGLAVVFGVVEEYGGTIAVESEPGAGTTFIIRFPGAGDTAAPDADATAPAVEPGDETLLLVEDDSGVRKLALRALEPYGYTVLNAAEAHEALAIAQSAERIDLLITDIRMPHMDGVELAAHVRAARPAIRVVLMSGYADDVLDAAALEHGTAFLQKPFSPAALARLVRSLLDEEKV